MTDDLKVQDTIDGVLIDSDEAGFMLILSGGRAEYVFRIQSVAVELLRAVKREIGPWWTEGEAVMAEMMNADPQYHLGRIAMAGALVVGDKGSQFTQRLLAHALKDFIASPAVLPSVRVDLKEAMKK